MKDFAIAQLAPPDTDTDGDLVPDRWETWLGTPTNNPAIGQGPYLDPDGDGFVSWYELNVLISDTNSAVSPLAPDANHTDILAEIISSRLCVLRLVGNDQTVEIPWMQGVSPDRTGDFGPCPAKPTPRRQPTAIRLQFFSEHFVRP